MNLTFNDKKGVSKKVGLLLLLMTLMVFLTGCVNQQVTITVAEDNSSSVSLQFTIDKADIEDLQLYGVEIPDNEADYPEELRKINGLFRKAANKFLSKGMEISDINDSFEIGFLASKSFNSYQELSVFLNDLYDEGLSPVAGMINVRNLKVLKDYSFNGEIKYVIDDEIVKKIDDFIESGESLGPDMTAEEFKEKIYSGKANLEILFPAKVVDAEGFDEEETSNSPIFVGKPTEEAKQLSLKSRNVYKQKAAIFATFGILAVIVVINILYNRYRRSRMY